jgi:hypothetical protein
MVRVNRIRSVCHSIAHHAASGVSFLHPHILAACTALGIRELEVNLLEEDPGPLSCRNNEPLRLSLRGVREKLSNILAAEGMTLEDLVHASLTFIRAPEARDDYSTICRAQLVRKDGAAAEVAVDFLGHTRSWRR